MRDVIDKIKSLSFRLPKEYEGLDGKNRAVMLDDVIDILSEQLKPGNDTNVGSKWIPCEVDLPKHTDEYNVTVGVASEFGYYEKVTTLRFVRIEGEEPSWVIPDGVYRVIAWCNLPEPYKGE